MPRKQTRTEVSGGGGHIAKEIGSWNAQRRVKLPALQLRFDWKRWEHKYLSTAILLHLNTRRVKYPPSPLSSSPG